MTQDTNPLRWIRNLPEVGASFTRNTVDKIDLIDAQIRYLAKQTRDLERERRNLVKDSERQARGLWAGNEIEEAKARANL